MDDHEDQYQRAIRMVVAMFRKRGYIGSSRVIRIGQNMWKILGRDADGKTVLGVIAPSKKYTYKGGEKESWPESDEKDRPCFETNEAGQRRHQPGSKAEQKEREGIHLVRRIHRWCKQEDVHDVVLVTDHLTTQAHSEISTYTNLDIRVFSYETGGWLPRHMFQPEEFRALRGQEREDFIRQNPAYRTELGRYGVNDVLVKYYGYKVGDIISIVDSDEQSGMTQDYAIVVDSTGRS